jgi:YfiH family protein
MDLIIPDWVGIPANIGALTTTRRGGFSRMPYDDGSGSGGLNLGLHVADDAHIVQQNRQLLKTLLPAEPAWLSQVHGVNVVDAAVVTGAPKADASIATVPGVICAIQTADCLPVLFCDVKGQVVGAAHAGWRGLLHGVLENTIERMQSAGADEIVAWLGPAIGPQCFEVGAEVAQGFIERDGDARMAFTSLADKPGKYLADIYQLARLAMKRAGVNKVYGSSFCTVTDHNRFYSYRRDKITGRMASLIWIK